MHVHGPACGCTSEDLRKAVGGIGPLGEGSAEGEGEDPEYLPLWRLIQAARRSWREWGARLVAEVKNQLDAGRLLPMTPDNAAVLTELLREHNDALVFRFVGGAGIGGGARVKQLVDAGLVTPEAAEAPGFVEVAYKLGRNLEALGRVARGEDRLVRVVRASIDRPYTATDRAAVNAVLNRGAAFARVPAERIAATVTGGLYNAARALTVDEQRAIQGPTAASIVAGETSRQLAARLRESVFETRIVNDLDRLARTELAFAFNEGAYENLLDRSTKGGEPDPKVHKRASPNACEHCIRIWGKPGAYIPYTLSFVRDRDNAGGNVGLPAREWGPTTGPTHPNCTCGPLVPWFDGLDDAVGDALRRMGPIRGSGR